MANYRNLAKWTQIYLKDIVFEPNRIAICLKILYNAAAEYKRDGSTIASFLSRNSTYKKGFFYIKQSLSFLAHFLFLPFYFLTKINFFRILL